VVFGRYMGCKELTWLITPERMLDIQGAAVAILPIRAEQRHTGLIYKTDDELRMLHLAWHHRVRDEEASSVHSVPLKLNIIQSGLVATACGIVAARFGRLGAEQLPYGLRHCASAFVGEGKLNIAGRTSGLTCATFVLAVLDYAGIELLDIATWPERLEDVQWQEQIIALLELGSPRAEPEHVAAVRADMPCARVRPEEVAAAASRWPPVAMWDMDLERQATGLVECLNEVFETVSASSGG